MLTHHNGWDDILHATWPHSLVSVRLYRSAFWQEWTLETLPLAEISRGNKSISHFPQCIGQISHNAAFGNKNVHIYAHFCYKTVHCGIWDWCIVIYGCSAFRGCEFGLFRRFDLPLKSIQVVCDVELCNEICPNIDGHISLHSWMTWLIRCNKHLNAFEQTTHIQNSVWYNTSSVRWLVFGLLGRALQG